MEDADEAVTEGAQGLVVQVAGAATVVVEGAGAGLACRAQKAHWSMASYRRRLRTWRASTARFLPDATVNGDVPA